MLRLLDPSISASGVFRAGKILDAVRVQHVESVFDLPQATLDVRPGDISILSQSGLFFGNLFGKFSSPEGRESPGLCPSTARII